MRDDTSHIQALGGALPEHVESLTKLLESANDVVWCMSLDGTELLYLNSAVEQIYGRPVAEFTQNAKLWFEAIHPDDREQVKQDLRHLLERRQIEHEYRIVRPDGEIRWLRDRVAVIYDDAGNAVRIGGIAIDISRQKEAEAQHKRADRAMRDSEALYHSLVDHLPIYVTRIDLDGRITYVNNNYCQLIGLPPDEILGKTNFDFHPPEYAKKYREDELRVAETGEVFTDVEENRRGNDVRYFEVRKSPVRDGRGNVIEIQAVFWDVTERHHAEMQREKAEAALREAKERAEAASRAKSTFLANMSHEIRTPMNAVIGLTELLLDGPPEPSQREPLELIRDSAESLLSVINDILDFSKIEAEKLELAPAEFDLHESLGDAMKTLALRAHTKHLELAYHVLPDVPSFLIGDVGRLRQIVINLVGNAIKFTDAGEVVVDVESESQPDDRVQLHFRVRDTGVGIPQDKLDQIFAAFEQADTSSTRRFGGTGLGLAISSRLVNLMEGRMWVESDQGRGSTFHFTAVLQRGTSGGMQPAALRPEALQGLRVLIVDDNTTNRQILEELMRSQGMQPITAAGGVEALDALRIAREAGQDVPLVLTDVNMPVMDGNTLAERIKQSPELCGTKVIALTSGDCLGATTPHDQRCFAALLTKPVKRSELFRAILTAMAQKPATSDTPPDKTPARPPQIRPLQVLLAEDSYANQALAVGLLKKVGHTVTVANNGREAVSLYESQPFDLVLMDVQMPEMDGFEATATIRSREEQALKSNRPVRRMPIVAMTAHALKGDREKCLAAGMDGYVAKPVRIHELYHVIADFFPEKREEPDIPPPESS